MKTILDRDISLEELAKITAIRGHMFITTTITHSSCQIQSLFINVTLNITYRKKNRKHS